MVAYSIYHQRDCESFNIDNLELHLPNDIPVWNYLVCNCEYDQESNVKKMVLCTPAKDYHIKSLISKSGWRKISSQNDSSLIEFKSFETKHSNINNISELYYKQGNYNGNKWKLVINKASGTMWLILNYAD